MMNGHPPEHAPDLPVDFPTRMLVYDAFAERYGWSPRVVDELNLDEIEWLPIVSSSKNDAREQLRDDD